MQADVLAAPTTGATNLCYGGNRGPLAPGPLVKLPLGSIRPKGWLRHQLGLMAEGMTGYLPENSVFLRVRPQEWLSAATRTTPCSGTTGASARITWQYTTDSPEWLRTRAPSETAATAGPI